MSSAKSTAMRVIARFRPVNGEDRARWGDEPDVPPVYVDAGTVVVEDGKGAGHAPVQYSFSQVCPPDTSQEAFYELAALPVVDAVLDGYNGTIFAYGQTGSGKTYTMFGPLPPPGDRAAARAREQTHEHPRAAAQQLGVFQRGVHHLFRELQARPDVESFTVTAQFVQIYVDDLLDLLEPRKRKGVKLAVKMHPIHKGAVFVQHLKEEPVYSAAQVLELLARANANRKVKGHALNTASSRSHMVILLHVVQRRRDGSIVTSKLNVADLAGSERVKAAHGDKGGDRMSLREANAINLSLSHLRTVITDLAHKGTTTSGRNTKLTHLLQDSLGGNARTTLVITASPHVVNRAQTIGTLDFGTVAKKVRTKPRKDEQFSKQQLLTMVKKLKAENHELSARVAELELLGQGVDFAEPLPIVDDVVAPTAHEAKEEAAGEEAAARPRGDSLALPPLGGKARARTLSRSESVGSLVDVVKALREELAAEFEKQAELCEQVAALEGQLEQVTAQWDKARDEARAADERCARLAQDASLAKEAADRLREDLAAQLKQHGQHVRELDEQAARQRENLARQQEDKVALQTRLEEAELRARTLAGEKESLEDQVRSLQEAEAKTTDEQPLEPTESFQRRETEAQDAYRGIDMTSAEAAMSPAQFLMARFGLGELLNDFRLTEEQRMQRTSRELDNLSAEIADKIRQWQAEHSSRGGARPAPQESSGLVFQVQHMAALFNLGMVSLRDHKRRTAEMEQETKRLRKGARRADRVERELQAARRELRALQAELAVQTARVQELEADEYVAGEELAFLDQSRSSSPPSVDAASSASAEEVEEEKGLAPVGEDGAPAAERSSRRPPTVGAEPTHRRHFSSAELTDPSVWRDLPVDARKRESYLSDDEFARTLGMVRDEFYALPKYMQMRKKKEAGLH